MKTRKIFLAVALLSIAGSALAQTNEEINESRRIYYNNYSRWSFGLNGGLSALFGDFSTFSDEKFYLSPIASLGVSYQLTPTIGFTLEGAYSHNEIGALSSNKDYYLNTTGFYSELAANPLTGENFMRYGDLYSKVNLIQGRVGVDINLSNVFGGNKGERMRTFNLIFSPSYYLQYYRPKVYRKDNDQRYTSRDLFYQVNNGVGAELAGRSRLGRVVDLQLKAGGAYGFNKKFDGIAGDKKTNILAYVQAGVVFKLNGKTKRDNLMYAATPAYVPMMDFNRPGATVYVDRIVHDTVTVTRVERVEVPVEVTNVVYRTIGTMPGIGFERGSAVINTEKYAAELATIVKFMQDYPDAEVDIYAWADHTGGDDVNNRISQQRAEALRDYLVEQGISASRIKRVEGCGKDTNLTGEEGLSVKARRAEVQPR